MNNRVDYFEKIENHKHNEFVKREGHCVLCSSPLEIQHEVKAKTNEIQEHAHCVECDVRVRVKTYPLN